MSVGPDDAMADVRRWRPVITAAAVLTLTLGCLALLAGMLPAVASRMDAISLALVLLVGGALLVAAAGLAPAALVLSCRADPEQAEAGLARWGGWPQAELAAVPLGLAAAALYAGWSRLPPTGPAPAPLLLGMVAAGIGFPLLVLERHLAAAGAGFPEARALAALVRLPLAALAGGGLAAEAVAAGVPVLWWLVPALSVVIGAVAAELLARCFAHLFRPDGAEVRALGRSRIAALVTGAGADPSARRLADTLGIDLSRSWALAFARRATPPIALGIAILAWGLSGVTVLRPDQRGIYERFGAPAAVFAPGLHTHLPWPFGSVRRIEFGSVHELTVAMPEEAKSAARLRTVGDADAPPPPDADRLWVESHPAEISYLVPGRRSRDAFDVVDLDLRLAYRIGLDDSAALAARYSVAEPETLLRAVAGAWLVRAFSTRTLDGLLREDTGRLEEDLKARLQQSLDDVHSGLEIVGVVIDAIHPPPGAAGAYHGVQAAEIRAVAEIAHEQRHAVMIAGEARENAVMVRGTADSTARETLTAAAIDRIHFLADRKAKAEVGDAVSLDRTLTALENALATATLTVVDHRLPTGGTTTLDLRPRGATAAGTAPADDVEASEQTPPEPPMRDPVRTGPAAEHDPDDGPDAGN